MILRGYSQALYSTWFFNAPDRILLDCGEGCALYLRQDVFAVEKIFLSHGHMDHVAGLLTFVGLRNGTMGSTEKPLTIYYPEGDSAIETIRSTILSIHGNYLKYKLAWVPINPGDEVALRKGRTLQVMTAEHDAPNPLSFGVVKERRKLKAHLQGRSPQELAQLSTEEKFDRYPVRLLVYSGDSMPMNVEQCEGAEILLHECTFLESGQRNRPVHSELQEVVGLANAANVQRLILFHISPRYRVADVDSYVSQAACQGTELEHVVPGQVTEFD